MESSSRSAESSGRRPDLRIPLLLLLASVGSSILVYLPYRHNTQPLYAFWDGPSYMIIAHDFYQVRAGNPLASDSTKPPFYASHLPGYPMLVRILAFAGYDHALLLATLLSTGVATWYFYKLASEVWNCRRPGFLTLVFLFVPPRWLLYHSVGASDPLFLAAVLASLYFFERGRLGRASMAAAVASATRFVGLLIIPAYAWILYRRGVPLRKWLWLALIPIAPALYAWSFIQRYGEVFGAVDRNLELLATPLPFSHLGRLINSWPGTEAEFYLLLSFLSLWGIVRLRKFQPTFVYCLVQFAFVSLLSGDTFRYSFAFLPFALVLGFEDLISTAPFRWLFPFLAAGSVYWAQRMVVFNTCKVYPEVARFLGIH